MEQAVSTRNTATVPSALVSSGTKKIALLTASVALAPLVAFAVLWTSLLIFIGGAWLLHLVGIG